MDSSLKLHVKRMVDASILLERNECGSQWAGDAPAAWRWAKVESSQILHIKRGQGCHAVSSQFLFRHHPTQPLLSGQLADC